MKARHPSTWATVWDHALDTVSNKDEIFLRFDGKRDDLHTDESSNAGRSTTFYPRTTSLLGIYEDQVRILFYEASDIYWSKSDHFASVRFSVMGTTT